MSTTVLAPESVDNAMNRPVPCMSGHAGSATARALAGAHGRDRDRWARFRAGPTPTTRQYRSSLRHITPLGMPVVPPV